MIMKLRVSRCSASARKKHLEGSGTHTHPARYGKHFDGPRLHSKRQLRKSQATNLQLDFAGILGAPQLLLLFFGSDPYEQAPITICKVYNYKLLLRGP